MLKYIYSSTVLRQNFEVFVLNLSISIFHYFVLLLHCISEGNVVLYFTASYLLLFIF